MSGNPILDVAIVGGGVSGLYSGWRLLAESGASGTGKPSVELFEGGSRLGGRLLSVEPPGIPDTRVELGGMRFTSSHKRVCALVDLFNLKKDDFPVGEPQNVVYVRGKMLRRQDLGDADLLPYSFSPDERDPSALALGFTALAAQRILRIVTGKDIPLDKADWDTISKTGEYLGRPLRDLPMQYLMLRSISEEAYKFAEDTSGYDSILHTWNAADGLPWNLADFGKTPDFYHLHDGFDALPREIAKRFEAEGGKTHLHHRLLRFDEATLPDGGKGIELHLAGPHGQEHRVRARKLILAMPRRSLELIDPTGPVLDPKHKRVRALIESVTPIPLFKLALCYPFPWWETIAPPTWGEGEGNAILKGQSITDLPVRQCYYWAVNRENQNAVVLIYDDGTDLAFWAGLRDRERDTDYAARAPAPGLWDEFKSPTLMVEEAHRQLLVMHGLTGRADIPKPLSAAYRDWGDDPYGGGANFWNVTANSAEVFDAILQPAPGTPVYVCGEAYSHDQGWTEGPLATADAMLTKHFGLGAPKWLKP